jgi:hypothetical protein
VARWRCTECIGDDAAASSKARRSQGRHDLLEVRMLVGVLARRETQKCGLQKSISSTWLREARLMSIPRSAVERTMSTVSERGPSGRSGSSSRLGDGECYGRERGMLFGGSRWQSCGIARRHGGEQSLAVFSSTEGAFGRENRSISRESGGSGLGPNGSSSSEREFIFENEPGGRQKPQRFDILGAGLPITLSRKPNKRSKGCPPKRLECRETLIPRIAFDDSNRTRGTGRRT